MEDQNSVYSQFKARMIPLKYKVDVPFLCPDFSNFPVPPKGLAMDLSDLIPFQLC